MIILSDFLEEIILKKQLLKIANIFIVANMIFLNTGVSATFTKAYTARQKMTSLFKREKNNEKQIKYKYLAEQLCIYFNEPTFPDKELTFNTPFGVTKLDKKSTRSIFIVAPRINTYDKIGKELDEVLTPEGRKQLANIILEYLQTNPDPDYKEKSFDTYQFKQSKFFDVISKKSKLYFNINFNFESYSENCKKLKELKEKLETCKQTAKKDLRSVKDKEEKEKIKNARKDSDKLNEQINKLDTEISQMVEDYKEKLEKAKGAATALCAILMIAETRFCRSFDGGKHERALMRDILNSEMKYADAFKNFIPSGKHGAKLAYKYSTNQNNQKEILKSENYSEDEELLESNNYSEEEESATAQKDYSLM